MEIEIYVTTFGTNNTGVSSIADLSPCTPTQNIVANVSNYGVNRIDSLDVMYQINGGTVQTAKYNSGSNYSVVDTIKPGGSKLVQADA